MLIVVSAFLYVTNLRERYNMATATKAKKKKPFAPRTKEDIYQKVTNRILQKLEEDIIPWRKPWQSVSPINWHSEKFYRGINAILLDGGEYATFKQIKAAGGNVKKGEQGHFVVFYKWIKVTDTETEEEKEIPMLKQYTVFEINTQCEGLTSKRILVEHKHNKLEESEAIIAGYPNAPLITNKENRAFYAPSQDRVNVPDIKHFKETEEYYATLFHELVHSTGHASRLNREGIVKDISFGSQRYSKEELVAEIGAAMLCSMAHIDNVVIDNSVSYIHSWMTKIKEDPKLIVTASSAAQKAVDYITSDGVFKY